MNEGSCRFSKVAHCRFYYLRLYVGSFNGSLFNRVDSKLAYYEFYYLRLYVEALMEARLLV